MRLVASLVLLLLTALPAQAQWSGTLAPRGGMQDSDATGSGGAGWLDGSLSFGLAPGYTAKLETAGGSFDSLTTLGGRGQVWWRDPSLALLGALAEYSDRDGLSQTRTGVKGEFYLGPFTLRGQGGYVFGDSKGSLQVEDSSYGVLSAGFYGLPGLGVNGGAAMQNGRSVGFLGGEARIPGLPEFMTATLDGAAGPNGYRQLLVGLRFYFGAGAGQSLQDRHVGDTPAFPGFDVGGFARARPGAAACVPNPSITSGFNGCTTLP